MSKKVLVIDSQLSLISEILEMGWEFKAIEGAPAKADPLEFYVTSHMENVSAGIHNGARPEGRGSLRAFVSLIRLKPEDWKQYKAALNYVDNEYYRFAVADTVVEVVRRTSDFKLALPFLKPAEGAKPIGPFYPNAKSFDLVSGLQAPAGSGTVRDFLVPIAEKSCGKGSAPNDTDIAVLKLAAIFRMEESSVKTVARSLSKLGVKDKDDRKVALAYVVLASLRATPRFVHGLKGCEPLPEPPNLEEILEGFK